MLRTSLDTPLKKRKFNRNEGLGEEYTLCNLPNHLLGRILSHLPTKDSVRSSVLSKRWRNVWLHVPALDLDTKNFLDHYEFLDFIDRFMESKKELDINRFELSYNVREHYHYAFVRRIYEVLKHRVCHLTVWNDVDLDEALVRMPLSLYSCASLVDLRLYCVVMDDPKSELVSLPCVKTMSLVEVKFESISSLETLISNCPVLEDLVVTTCPHDNLEVVCVRSQSLKSFKLHSLRRCNDPVFEIDAPRLEYMSITNYQCAKFRIHNIGPSTEVSIDVVSDLEDLEPLEITMIRDFIIGISNVRKMRISARSLVAIHGFSKLEPLPHFTNLSFVNALLGECSWEVLSTFLGCCKKLHSLFVELDNFLPDIEEIEVSPLPQCFLSSLKFVTMETLIPITDASKKRKIADYFLRNCSDLKEVVFR